MVGARAPQQLNSVTAPLVGGVTYFKMELQDVGKKNIAIIFILNLKTPLQILEFNCKT